MLLLLLRLWVRARRRRRCSRWARVSEDGRVHKVHECAHGASYVRTTHTGAQRKHARRKCARPVLLLLLLML